MNETNSNQAHRYSSSSASYWLLFLLFTLSLSVLHISEYSGFSGPIIASVNLSSIKFQGCRKLFELEGPSLEPAAVMWRGRGQIPCPPPAVLKCNLAESARLSMRMVAGKRLKYAQLCYSSILILSHGIHSS